jgi:hypothetical protein
LSREEDEMRNTSDPRRANHPSAAPQTFTDEQQVTDRQRSPRANHRIRKGDAEAADQKQDVVDRVHGLSR